MTPTDQQSSRSDLLRRFAASGRNHPYLAFTLNSICNLDCVFCKPRCMPDYGHKDKTLTVSDYAGIANEGGLWGIRKAHCSGGEPTLRADILDIIGALSDGLGDEATVGMTSHGNLRRGLTVDALHDAGLTYLNISLHSLDPARSTEIMGGGDPRVSRATIDRALELGLKVKINCVLQRSYLDDAFGVAELAKRLPIAVRLIELQRIGPAEALFPTEFLPEAEVRERLHAWFEKAGEISRTELGVRSPGQYLRPPRLGGLHRVHLQLLLRHLLRRQPHQGHTHRHRPALHPAQPRHRPEAAPRGRHHGRRLRPPLQRHARTGRQRSLAGLPLRRLRPALGPHGAAGRRAGASPAACGQRYGWGLLASPARRRVRVTTVRSTTSYTPLGAIYVEQLAAQGVTASMLTHKWQTGDLIAPHSDIDIRVILDQAPTRGGSGTSGWPPPITGRCSWTRPTAGCSNIRPGSRSPPASSAGTRCHRPRSPPGAWSRGTRPLSGGGSPVRGRCRGAARTRGFYRGILDARIGGRYQLDKDSTDNVHHDLDGYRRHCVVWHYVAPCWFASAALATRTRCPGKTGGPRPVAPRRARSPRQGVPPPVRLLLGSGPFSRGPTVLGPRSRGRRNCAAHRAPGRCRRHRRTSEAEAWTTTAGMLRVRVARWIYYLDPPPETATGYLIAREEKELRSARNTLTRLADRTSGADASLVKAMTELLPPGPTTTGTLRDLLAQWSRHRSVVEDFLSANSA